MIVHIVCKNILNIKLNIGFCIRMDKIMIIFSITQVVRYCCLLYRVDCKCDCDFFFRMKNNCGFAECIYMYKKKRDLKSKYFSRYITIITTITKKLQVVWCESD